MGRGRDGFKFQYFGIGFQAPQFHILTKTSQKEERFFDVVLSDKSTAPLGPFKFSLGDQLADRLADGGAADLKFLAKFGFGGDLSTRFPGTRGYLVLNIGFKLIVKWDGTVIV